MDGAVRVGYAALARRVDALARALLAAGVRHGDRVASLTPPSLRFWEIYLAATSIGAIWVGINPVYQRTEFAHLIANADPVVVLAMSPASGRNYVGELVEVGLAPERVVAMAEDGAGDAWAAFLARGATIGDAQVSAARARVAPQDTAVIVYTSGTTGVPKGAMLSHRALVAMALANRDWMGAGLESAICAAPVNHVGALCNICMCVFAFGGKLIFYPRVDMAALAALARAERPAYLVSSPTGFLMMFSARQPASDRLLSTRLIVFGGAATPKQMLARVAVCGAQMSSVYGQTETCGIVTRTLPGASLDDMADTIGTILPGADLRIADSRDRVAGPGQTGEIQIRGPYVMSGYFRNEDATREAFTPDGYLRTGDLGFIRPDGNAVFVGRLKEMFKSGGYNVYPLEVETAACAHEAVEVCVVVPVAHERFQEVGHAFVKPRAGAAVGVEDLRAFLRDRIAHYKIPKTFSFETALPLLANGKVDRLALKARAAALAAA